jgi:hypothetical protein
VFLLVLLVALAGCSTLPDTGTPVLTPAQVQELQAHAQTPQALGVTIVNVPGGMSVLNANVLSATQSVTVALVKLPVDGHDTRGVYRVPVVLATVNGRANIPVMLDSGSNRNLVGYSLARRCEIPVLTGLPVMASRGIGGAVDNYPAVVPAVQIRPDGGQVGGLELRRLMALIGPDSAVMKLPKGLWGDAPVLLLGLNALQSLASVTIDYRQGTVTFAPSGDYRPATAGATFTPLRWDGELPVVDVRLDDKLTAPAVLDTGGDYGLIVPRTMATQLGYWKPGREKLATSQGVGGTALAARYDVRWVRVGAATVRAVPARTELIGPEPAGGRLLLGNEVLRRYRVTFDFKRSVFWLE